MRSRFLAFLLPVLVAAPAAVLAGRALAAEDAEVLPGPFHKIRVVDFEGPIAAVIAAYVIRQADDAVDEGCDCLVLRIESPGGTVLHSEKIADHLLDLPDEVHVVAWIPNYAYSGASMVALSCDEIVMASSAHLGDAQPGIPVPEGWKPVGEKAESPLRAKFRAYAQANGYPIALAEAMVSERIEVIQVEDPEGGRHYVKGEDFRAAADDAEILPGVRKKDLRQVGAPVVRAEELLTLTAQEAHRYGFLKRTFGAEGPFPKDEADLLAHLKAEDATVTFVSMSFSETASRFLMDIAGILSAIVAISLLLLLWQGPGVMTIVGGAALVLVLLINATADQLNGFPLFLIAVGILLLAAEIFVIPGFGVAGILGILAVGMGFLFLAGGASFEDTSGLTGELVVDFGLQFLITMLLALSGLFLLSRWVPSLGPGRRMVLAAPSGPPPAVAITKAPTSVGAVGRTVSPLRPSGAAEIDGRVLDVLAEGGYVAADRRVEVVSVEGHHVTVRALDPAADERTEAI